MAFTHLAKPGSGSPSRALVACAAALACFLAGALVERELWRWRDGRSHYRADLYRERVEHLAEVDKLRNVIALAPYARRRRAVSVLPLQRGRDVRA